MIPAKDGIILDLNMVVKASTGAEGQRLVTVEASNEQMDTEGDVILQKALLDSSSSFLKDGHIDIDHKSEIGHRLGIPDPERYIIGEPRAVDDIGSGRTAVKSEIYRNANGEVNPEKFMYDHFWCSLNTMPPTKWRASIYGIAKDIDTHSPKADRHVVKSINWKSLAFTRRPINQSIEGFAKIITAKAYVEELKNESLERGGFMPTSREELLGDYELHINRTCECTAKGQHVVTQTVREHFMKCRGLSYAHADLTALALKQLIKKA